MDEEEFTRIDQLIFERLHRGSLAPIVVHVKDGSTLTGGLLAVHRSGAVGATRGSPTGELCLSTESGRITVRYDQISDIS